MKNIPGLTAAHLIRLAILAGAVFAMGIIRAHASTFCVPVKIPRDLALQHGGHWTDVTPERYRFLEGIYLMAPSTPPGLPPGASAVLAWKDGEDGASVWFIDGDTACGPMDIPQALVKTMERLYEVKHVGDRM